MFHFELRKDEYWFKHHCYLFGHFSVLSMADELNIPNLENDFVNQIYATLNSIKKTIYIFQLIGLEHTAYG